MQKTYLLGAEGVPALRGFLLSMLSQSKFFKGVSLKVFKGEFLCILGTSGGGKTTLLNLMGTIDKPTKVCVKIIWIFIKYRVQLLYVAIISEVRHLINF